MAAQSTNRKEHDRKHTAVGQYPVIEGDMADQQQAPLGAVWSRIPLPHTAHLASAHGFDLWIWHPQQTPTPLTQELRAALLKRGWKHLSPSRLEQLFCLR